MVKYNFKPKYRLGITDPTGNDTEIHINNLFPAKRRGRDDNYDAISDAQRDPTIIMVIMLGSRFGKNEIGFIEDYLDETYHPTDDTIQQAEDLRSEMYRALVETEWRVFDSNNNSSHRLVLGLLREYARQVSYRSAVIQEDVECRFYEIFAHYLATGELEEGYAASILRIIAAYFEIGIVGYAADKSTENALREADGFDGNLLDIHLYRDRPVLHILFDREGPMLSDVSYEYVDEDGETVELSAAIRSHPLDVLGSSNIQPYLLSQVMAVNAQANDRLSNEILDEVKDSFHSKFLYCQGLMEPTSNAEIGHIITQMLDGLSLSIPSQREIAIAGSLLSYTNRRHSHDVGASKIMVNIDTDYHNLKEFLSSPVPFDSGHLQCVYLSLEERQDQPLYFNQLRSIVSPHIAQHYEKMRESKSSALSKADTAKLEKVLRKVDQIIDRDYVYVSSRSKPFSVTFVETDRVFLENVKTVIASVPQFINM